MMSLTFGLFTQVSDSGPQGPLVFNSDPFRLFNSITALDFSNEDNRGLHFFSSISIFFFSFSFFRISRSLSIEYFNQDTSDETYLVALGATSHF